MFSILDASAGAVYQRPLSLEEAPAREVGSFMREGREGRGGGFYGDRRRSRNLPEEVVADVEEIVEEDDEDSAE